MAQEDVDTSIARSQKLSKPHELLTCTVRNPAFAYAHLQLLVNGQASDLDELQIKSYCTAALRQFLGLTGAAVPVDLLKVQGSECWVRIPRQDLGAFAAAVTAWRGHTNDDGGHALLRLHHCSDWLGTLASTYQSELIWGS